MLQLNQPTKSLNNDAQKIVFISMKQECQTDPKYDRQNCGNEDPM